MWQARGPATMNFDDEQHQMSEGQGAWVSLAPTLI